MRNLYLYNSLVWKIANRLSSTYVRNTIILTSKSHCLKMVVSCDGSVTRCFSAKGSDNENFNIVKHSTILDKSGMKSNFRNANNNNLSETPNEELAESLLTNKFDQKVHRPKTSEGIVNHSVLSSPGNLNLDQSSIDAKSMKQASSTSGLVESLKSPSYVTSPSVGTLTVQSSVASKSPAANNNQEKALQSGIPEVPTTCCQSGCFNCVWLEYADQLTRHYSDGGKEAIAAIHRDIEDPNLREYLLFELRIKKKNA